MKKRTEPSGRGLIRDLDMDLYPAALDLGLRGREWTKSCSNRKRKQRTILQEPE